MGSNIIVVISILFDGENISFEASLVMYINNTNIPPNMIMNRIYQNQNLLYIFPLIRHTIVVCINNITPMAIGCFIYIHNKTSLKRNILTIKQNTNNHSNITAHLTIHSTDSNQQQRNKYTDTNTCI